MDIAEILKHCPKGIKLYSPTWGNVKLIEVTSAKVIKIKVWNFTEELTSDGRYSDNGECVIFPSKDQRDWGKFRLPFKAGDIVMTIDKLTPFIFKEYIDDTYAHCYCGVDVYDTLKIEAPTDIYWTSSFIIPASEEAKKELFSKIAEAGYKWNASTLELEKIGSEFKEGDVVINCFGHLSLISEVLATKVQIIASLSINNFLRIHTYTTYLDIDDITLATNDSKHKLFSALVREGYKYDKEGRKLVKQEFKPFDKVLARDTEDEPWKADIYLDYDEGSSFPYICTGDAHNICIPYEGNEYLLGTTDSLT